MAVANKELVVVVFGATKLGWFIAFRNSY